MNLKINKRDTEAEYNIPVITLALYSPEGILRNIHGIDIKRKSMHH